MTSDDKSLFELVAQGGWTMVPLLVCSVVSLFVLVQKALQLVVDGVARTHVLVAVQTFVDDGDLARLIERAVTEKGPLATVLTAGARVLEKSPPRAEEEFRRAAMVELERLERGLPILSFVAQAAPLFGLLGTVIGMVELFASMEAGGASLQTSALSSGIWKALLTTAAGLIIAIPALGGHVWLGRVLDRLRVRINDGASRILTAHAARHPSPGAAP